MTKQLQEGQARPFLKWAGGKSQLLPEIRKVYPEGLGTTITRYAEPFLGGGAVLLDILSTYCLEAVYASDTNGELINAYCCVRDRLEELLERLHQMETDYLALDSQARKDFYYRIRAQFNAGERGNKEGAERAALLLFLNRTCFNGLYRVNARGEFNVPAGAYKNPTICDEDNLRRVSGLLQGVELVCAPYTQVEEFADERKVTLWVKEARLGYMGIHDVRNREREKEGKMIPVWDFLGSVSVEYFKEGKSVGKETYSQPDLSLMTINAMDGSVMERRDMGK